MKLAEALQLLKAVDPVAPEYSLSLVSGSTAEPLAQLLAAHIQTKLPGRRVRVNTGLFGDLPGNLERHLQGGSNPAAVVIEWADFDPRLGIRQSGRWGRGVAEDVLSSVETRLNQCAIVLEQIPPIAICAISPPGLPIAPVVPVPGWQMSSLETALEESLARFLVKVSALKAVRILSRSRLAAVYPGERLDVRSCFQAGFPYRIPYAATLASLLATLMLPPSPAKGLITDLDQTLWKGILGEVGSQQVWWDLDHHAGIYGVYQQFLRSLAEDGVLVAVASKNDAALVEEAFRRPDFLLPRGAVFPVEAHWKPKPESVERILAAWNVGADSVVFVDDSPLEVAEMKAAFPEMDCRQFPAEDPDAAFRLLGELTDRLGKPFRIEEDTLRLESLQATATQRKLESSGYSREDILRSAEAELTIMPVFAPPDPRALELVNKTNQFNLNGERYPESDWLRYLGTPGAAVWIAAYRDKFGSLGKIAVLAGRKSARRMEVDVWVLSCRAFSRRIEFAMLDFLFADRQLDDVLLRFRQTSRNGPLREFLEELSGAPLETDLLLTREQFATRKPEIYLTTLGAETVSSR